MTITVEKIQQLLQELGPSTPDIDAVAQTEDPSWAIQFSDETVILIEPTDDPGRMVISADLGHTTDSMQLPIYETLLCYNLLWRQTGGVKIGLAGPKGSLIVSTEVCVEGLTLNDLQQELMNFVMIVRAWSRYVADGGKELAPPLPGMETNQLHLHA
jgi:hypothetical protein